MKEIRFLKSVYKIDQLPKIVLPEIILCGRSNVGKSSFINSIFNKKKLAQTSSTPGKTKSLNYYKVDDKFYIVDLPGFGYAKVSKTERNSWQKLIQDYLSVSKNIVTAFHFIDSRHKPTPLDIYLNEFLRELDIPYTVILNKVDKLKQSEKSLAVRNAKEVFPELILNDNLLNFSSETGIGKKEIVNRLTKLLY